MIFNILILLGIASTSFTFGFRIGVKHGIEISVKLAIKSTILALADEFDKLGMKDTFKNVVEDIFGLKFNWEEEQIKESKL